MATFTSFMDQLPDPNFKINTAGASDSSGSAGPGFAKIKFSSNNQVQVGRTISGRGITASPGYHMWEFSINYNPMTRAEFEPVSNFIESRRARLYPFYVVLPQHAAPQNSTFATYTASTNPPVAAATTAGASTLTITVPAVNGDPSPGDFLNISDPNDANHKKAYKVVRVETNTTYQTGTTQPATTQRRIHIIPPLSRAVSSSAATIFSNPKFRVIQKSDTIEYDLDTDNLYQFSLNLEEILP
jgi:hypothetical protein